MLLKILSDVDFYNTFILLNSTPNIGFTESWLDKITKDLERQKKIIQGLKLFGFIEPKEIELNEAKIITYTYIQTTEFIVFLTILNAMVSMKKLWSVYSNGEKVFFSIDKN